MAETVYNFTIADTSPTLTYSPYVAGDSTTGGWQSTCPTYVTSANGQNSYMCDPDSAHSTNSYKASIQLSFEGVGIYLLGNTTNSLGYDVLLDGVSFPGNPKPDTQLLYSAVGLEPGQHSIVLTVRQPASSANPGLVTFREAVVSVGTGRAGASVTKSILDDGDSKIQYNAPPGGNWTIEDTYPQSIGPDGVSSTTFHDSYWTDATATVNFQGTGVFAYGACYSHSRFAAYAASVDGAPEASFDGTVNLYSTDGVVKQRAGNCLRYFKTGLDGTKDHKLVLRVKDAGRVAVDWVEVVSVSGGSATDGNHGSGSGGNGSSKSSSPKVGILAGAIGGGVVLLIAFISLLIFLRRRKKNNSPPQQVQPQAQYNATQFNGAPGSYPDPQMQVNPYAMPITPPWPQPQSPGPNYLAAPGPGIGAMGPGTRTSFASSGAPLVSPGIASTYSGSGSGWPHGGSSYNGSSTPGLDSPGLRSMNAASGGFVFENNMAGTGVGASGSNVAVEAGGSSARFDAGSLSGPVSPAPPAYDQGGYISTGGGKGH